MVDYSVVKNENAFEVIENATNRVVYIHPIHSEAKKMMKHLNLGGGFASWTPNFFQPIVKKAQN